MKLVAVTWLIFYSCGCSVHFNFSQSHHGFTELSTVEWLQMLLVWALKSLNKFKMDFSHFGDEAMEKENFLFLGFSFFFISLLQMCCHFSSKLNQWPSVILREFFWTYFGKNYLYENINYLQEFHFAIQNEIIVLGMNYTLKRNRWTVSATHFLCNQNTSFSLWSPR